MTDSTEIVVGEVEELSEQEGARLAKLEERIAPVVHGFVDAGEALAEIRESRLYREYGTFEDYCRDKWDFVASRARQLIAASEVAGSVTTVTPSSERVARELMPLRSEPVNLNEAWEQAVEEYGERPTAEQVREVVQAKVVKPEPQEHTYTSCPCCRGTGQVRSDKPLGWTKEN